MGRHSSPGQASYYRSLLAWFLPWVLIAAVAITAVWIAVDAVGGDDAPVAATSPSPRTDRSPDAEQTPEPQESSTPTVAPSPTKSRPTKDPAVQLITEGISIQVLNATDNPDADELMVDRLTKLGFHISSVDSASRTYSRTTVFYSNDAAIEAGEALAARFGWLVEEKPANLSDTVDLHVIVGVDESG